MLTPGILLNSCREASNGIRFIFDRADLLSRDYGCTLLFMFARDMSQIQLQAFLRDSCIRWFLERTGDAAFLPSVEVNWERKAKNLCKYTAKRSFCQAQKGLVIQSEVSPRSCGCSSKNTGAEARRTTHSSCRARSIWEQRWPAHLGVDTRPALEYLPLQLS